MSYKDKEKERRTRKLYMKNHPVSRGAYRIYSRKYYKTEKYRINRKKLKISGAAYCHNITLEAISTNLLPNLKCYYIKCSRCDSRATEYDHRDYNFPLYVSAVCHKCNINLGIAISINKKQ